MKISIPKTAHGLWFDNFLVKHLRVSFNGVQKLIRTNKDLAILRSSQTLKDPAEKLQEGDEIFLPENVNRQPQIWPIPTKTPKPQVFDKDQA